MTETGFWSSLVTEACGRFLEVNSEVNLRSILVHNSVEQGLNSVEHSVKQVLNSVRHVKNVVKTQSNGRANPINLK